MARGLEIRIGNGDDWRWLAARARPHADFVLSLDTAGSSLLVAVGIVSLLGVAPLAFVLKLL